MKLPDERLLHIGGFGNYTPIHSQGFPSIGWSKDNLRVWAKLFLDTSGQTEGGWIVSSWSEVGAPDWQPRLNWLDENLLDKSKRKLRRLFLTDAGLQIGDEDNDIEPERARFIRAAVEGWKSKVHMY